MELNFVSSPNLPINPVKTVLIGQKYVNILGKSLERQGISVISVPENPHIQRQVASHADMSICHLGGNLIVSAQSVFQKFYNMLPNDFNIVRAGRGQEGEYPQDIGLNACLIGGKLFHNLKYTDPMLIAEGKLKGLDLYNVNQGYSKCSVCVLQKDRIITSDKGIHKLAEKTGIKSLLIKSGSIELEGYNTGFIGGCCGKLSDNKIAFTGTLNKHPDEKKIINFIEESNIEIIYLTDRPVFDVGSIIPLIESS